MRPKFLFIPISFFYEFSVDSRYEVYYLCCKIECPAACFCDPKLVYVIRQQNLFSPFQILMYYFHHSKMSWKRTQICCCLIQVSECSPMFSLGTSYRMENNYFPHVILQCIQCSNSVLIRY